TCLRLPRPINSPSDNTIVTLRHNPGSPFWKDYGCVPRVRNRGHAGQDFFDAREKIDAFACLNIYKKGTPFPQAQTTNEKADKIFSIGGKRFIPARKFPVQPRPWGYWIQYWAFFPTTPFSVRRNQGRSMFDD